LRDESGGGFCDFFADVAAETGRAAGAVRLDAPEPD